MALGNFGIGGKKKITRKKSAVTRKSVTTEENDLKVRSDKIRGHSFIKGLRSKAKPIPIP